MSRSPITLALLVLTALSPVGVSADGSCTIATQTPSVLSTYISDLHAAVSTIESAPASTDSTCQPDPSGGNDAYIRAIGSGLDASSFAAYASFVIDTRLSSEVPKGIDRDHTLLTTELSSLRDAFRIVYQSCRDTASVPSAIPHYRSGESAGKALIDLTTNHVRILTYYRKLIGGGGAGRLFGTTNDPDFILVDDAAFRSQMRDAYGQKSYNVCVTQGDYAKQVDTRITDIGRKQDGIGQAEGEWKSAWPLLQNKDQSAEDKKTKQMDADLVKVGIEPNAPSVLENTEKSLTTTDDSQGLTGVMRTIGRMVSDALDQMGGLFTTEKKPLTAPESSIQVTDASARLGSSSQITEHMTADFQAMMSQIAQQNVSFDESMSHLTGMLEQDDIADQEAGKRIETAEEICRRQDTKRGVCKQ